MIKKIKGNFPDFKSFEKFNRAVPLLLANEIQNHFVEGFRKGGGQTDLSRSGWQRRKAGARRNRGRAILVDTGQLRRDIQKRMVTKRKIVVGTRNAQYGIYHNDGTGTLPQREFIGVSKALEKKLTAIINREIKRFIK